MSELVRPIVGQYRLSQGILETGIRDLSDADAKTRSRGGTGPSISWTIGHLCHFKHVTLGLLGQQSSNPYAAQFAEAGATDGADYPSMSALAASFAELNAALCAALEASPERLDAPMPGAGAHEEKTILDTVLFFAWHEAYHIGSIGAIRKDLGRKQIADLVTGR